MKYRITVSAQRPRKEDDTYDSFDTVYEQIIDDLDIQAVIRAVNNSSNLVV